MNYKQKIALYESTTLPELRNQILNTKVYLTPDEETMISNKMREIKYEMQDEITATKKDLYSQVNQAYRSRKELEEEYNALAVASKQAKNDMEEQNKRLQNVIDRQTEELHASHARELAFSTDLETYKKNQEVLPRTNEITSDRQGLELAKQLRLQYQEEKVATNNRLFRENKLLEQVKSNDASKSAQELKAIKKDLAKQMKECNKLLEEKEGLDLLVRAQDKEERVLIKQNKILAQMMASMTDDTSTYINDASNFL